MKFTKDKNQEAQVEIEMQEIKNVNKFRYIKALINIDGRDLKEIKTN